MDYLSTKEICPASQEFFLPFPERLLGESPPEQVTRLVESSDYDSKDGRLAT